MDSRQQIDYLHAEPERAVVSNAEGADHDLFYRVSAVSAVEVWSGRISVAFLSGHCAVAWNGRRPGGQPDHACTVGPTDNEGRRERGCTGRGEAQGAGVEPSVGSAGDS
jgi:hypothetical protein